MTIDREPTTTRRRLRAWAFRAAALALAYLVLGGTLSSLYYCNRLDRQALHLREAAGDEPSVTFDPVSGYRLSRLPVREAVFTPDGQLASLGHAQGNNWGYPDRQDFHPGRSRPGVRRLAVLGDSFTSAQFLETNWPERVEERLAAEGLELELLNFSVHGGGLMNWWMIARHHILARHLELDGVIFAPALDDLTRLFHVRQERSPADGRWVDWAWIPELDPARLPQTEADAATNFLPMPQPVRSLAPASFEAALANPRAVPFTRPALPLIAVGARTLARVFEGLPPDADPRAPLGFDEQRLALMTRLAASLRQAGLPVLVVHLWSPNWRGDQPEPAPSRGDYPEPTCAFAAVMDADYLDGSSVFRGLEPQQLRRFFLPGDGHWNQAGSDRFAQWMARELRDWPVRADAPAGVPRP